MPSCVDMLTLYIVTWHFFLSWYLLLLYEAVCSASKSSIQTELFCECYRSQYSRSGLLTVPFSTSISLQLLLTDHHFLEWMCNISWNNQLQCLVSVVREKVQCMMLSWFLLPLQKDDSDFICDQGMNVRINHLKQFSKALRNGTKKKNKNKKLFLLL